MPKDLDLQVTRTDGEIVLRLLRAIDANATVTQRSMARELGIALGLANAYLKRCVSKGLIKVQQIPANRYVYYLTPQGFAEKSALAAEYLQQSLGLFRQAHRDYKLILDKCAAHRWTRICVCGCSDLADIFILLTAEYDVRVVGIYDPARTQTTFHGHDVFNNLADVPEVDGWVIASLADTQKMYDALAERIPVARVLVPTLLDVRVALASAAQERN